MTAPTREIPLLACRELSVTTRSGTPLLEGISADFASGGLHAIIGPSGCGKTTFLRALVGLIPSHGEVLLAGHPVTTGDLAGRVGFAPQFSVAHARLTVGESLDDALRLHQRSRATRDTLRSGILETLGLAEHVSKRVDQLSGGQLRRLGLGLELTTDPLLLLCDEVTTGLDPLAEDRILGMLRDWCARRGRTVLCVLHNLGALDRFDTVAVLHERRLQFQGTPERLRAGFGVTDLRRLFDALESGTGGRPSPTPPGTRPSGPPAGTAAAGLPAVSRRPGFLLQTGVLLRRRARLFRRDHGQLALVLALTFGFPCLVVIFALGGLPQIANLALEPPPDPLADLRAVADYEAGAARTAALVSGLVMFQVILLTLMGSNTGAREIAAERPVYEKERLAGLRPTAYVASKLVYIAVLSAFQGAWMTIFVKLVCGFPGDALAQGLVLAGTTFAMASVCLGVSAALASPEKASLLSIYFVGFQLPLSGVVLALPAALIWVIRPFIAAYWGWAGYLGAMRDTQFYDVVARSAGTPVAPVPVALGVLAGHALLGAALCLWGCERRPSGA